MPEDFRPLSGRRVVSIAQQLPGPYCRLLLADLGAEVVLVEQVRGGDPARVFPALFAAANRGKSSVAIDLKTAEGVEVFLRLASTAMWSWKASAQAWPRGSGSTTLALRTRARVLLDQRFRAEWSGCRFSRARSDVSGVVGCVRFRRSWRTSGISASRG